MKENKLGSFDVVELEGRFPFATSLQDRSGNHRCGGALIKPR